MRPTPSRLELASSCLYPWSLDKWPESQTSEAAAFGSAFHELAAKAIRMRVMPGDAATRAACVNTAAKFGVESRDDDLFTMVEGFLGYAAERFYLRCCKRMPEQPLVYNAADHTARTLTVEEHRAYKTGENEFAGTADFVFVDAAGNLFVYDWKTGQQNNTSVCRENRQMSAYALMAARALGHESVTATLAYVAEDGTVVEDTAYFDEFDLAVIEQDLSALNIKLTKHNDPTPGEHCHWCPVVSVCPATQHALEQVAPPEPPAEYTVSLDIQSNDHAAWTLHRLRAVREAADAVEAAVKAWADQNGGIRLASGKTYAAREVQVERLAINDAAAAIIHQMAPDALKVSSTKADIKKACGKDKDKEAAIMAALRECGAVSVSTTKRYDER